MPLEVRLPSRGITSGSCVSPYCGKDMSSGQSVLEHDIDDRSTSFSRIEPLETHSLDIRGCFRRPSKHRENPDDNEIFQSVIFEMVDHARRLNSGYRSFNFHLIFFLRRQIFSPFVSTSRISSTSPVTLATVMCTWTRPQSALNPLSALTCPAPACVAAKATRCKLLCAAYDC